MKSGSDVFGDFEYKVLMQVPIRDRMRLNPQDLQYEFVRLHDNKMYIVWRARPTDLIVDIEF